MNKAPPKDIITVYVTVEDEVAELQRYILLMVERIHLSAARATIYRSAKSGAGI
jgi:hypothetical protein